MKKPSTNSCIDLNEYATTKTVTDPDLLVSLDKVIQETESQQCYAPIKGVISRICVNTNQLLVDFAFQGKQHKQIPAQTHIHLTEDDLLRDCTLLFLEGDLTQPVIAGLLMDLNETRDQRVFESDHSIVLKAGKAEIVLEDDSVEIRGEFVTTEASSLNKVTGGAVKVN